MQRLGARQVADPNDPSKKIWRTADGKNDLIDTRYHFGHVVGEDGSLSAAVISFSSTGHGSSREWMTLMNNFKIKTPDGRLVVAPSWSKKYLVGSKPRANKKGDFFVAVVHDLGAEGLLRDPALRAAGKEMNAAFKTGGVRADVAADAAGDAGVEKGNI